MATNPIYSRLLIFAAMVLIAALAWIYVTAAENRVGLFSGKIPVSLKNLPADLVALPLTDAIEVRLRADRTGWSHLSVDSFVAQLDLSGLSAGIHEVPITVAISVPNVLIVEKKPATVMVRIEESISKNVPVRVVVQGKAAIGKSPGEATVAPRQVQAIGAKSIVATITDAQAVVTLNGEDDNVTRTVRLVALDQRGESLAGIRFEPSSVGVTIPIVQASDVRTVGVRLVTYGTVKPGYFVQKISVSPATVTIIGNDKLTSIDTMPVDLSGLATTEAFTPELIYPDSVRPVDGVNRVTVTLTLAPLPTSKQVPVTYTFTNLDPALKVDKVEPASGVVVVAGPADTLAGLNAVTATVSLSGRMAGAHNIDIHTANIQAPQNTTVSGSPTPSSITVTLMTK